VEQSQPKKVILHDLTPESNEALLKNKALLGKRMKDLKCDV
jgi:hypothetical protein